jgi:hypothetical protein
MDLIKAIAVTFQRTVNFEDVVCKLNLLVTGQ